MAGTSAVVWAQLKTYFPQTGEYPSLHVPNSVSSSSLKSYILLMTSPGRAPATLGWPVWCVGRRPAFLGGGFAGSLPGL